jgi:hypothetical protein
MALSALTPQVRREFFGIFPDLAQGMLCRKAPTWRSARRYLKRRDLRKADLHQRVPLKTPITAEQLTCARS